MDVERSREIQRILKVVLSVDEAAWPQAVLAACAGDAELRCEVETLLARVDRARGFLETPAIEVATAFLVESESKQGHAGQEDRRIGAFKVVRELGRGGMSRVFLAQRADGEYEQQVALKLLRPGFDSDLDIVRFRAERQILASLDHPNIARLLDGGVTDDGLPYIVLEHVAGEPIDRYCAAGELPVRARLELFLAVVDAVEYAHRSSVVHRDLKPSNILVRTDGTVKLLDFGLAKMLESPGSAAAPTRTKMRWMTPEYAAPEQVSGAAATERTDVYQLGAVLYELLAGHTPFGDRARTTHELETAVLEEDPAPLPDVVHRDLAAVVCKALRKTPAERYPSARELADDVRRYLSGHPVRARDQTLWYRARQLLARRRSQVAAASAIAPVLIVAFLTASPRHVAPNGPPRRANAQATTARRALAVLPFTNLSGNPQDQYFSDGVTEELIGALSQIQALRVVSGASSFAFRNQKENIRAVGRALQVGAVVDGSVRKDGNRVSVSARVINTTDGSVVWSQTYELQGTDVVNVQGELTYRIAAALEAELTTRERGRLARSKTNNLEAYDLYLQGMHFSYQRSREGLQSAIEYLQRAIDADPQFAAAYAGLANVYPPYVHHGFIPPWMGREGMRKAALHAVALDPDLADAQVALATYLSFFEWDWVGGEEAFRRAIELDPSNARAHGWYSFLLVSLRRYEEGLREAEKQADLSPLGPSDVVSPAVALLLGGKTDGVIDGIQKGVDRDSTVWLVQMQMGWARELRGELDEAIRTYQRAVRLAGATSVPKAHLARVLALRGRASEARQILGSLQAEATSTGVYLPQVATVLSALGQTDEAVKWLVETIRLRHPALLHALVEPGFESLRGDTRVAAMLRQHGFPQ